MGLRDYINSTTETISGGLSRSREIVGGVRASGPYLIGAWQNTRNLARVASESAVWTKQAVAERIPDREGWERLGRLGWRIADHAIDHGTKTYTCGIPVYRIMKEELGKKDKPSKEEKPVKEKKDNNVEFAALTARIESLEKENMELQQLKFKMENFEKKITEIKQESENQKTEKRKTAVLMEWNPPELNDFI